MLRRFVLVVLCLLSLTSDLGLRGKIYCLILMRAECEATVVTFIFHEVHDNLGHVNRYLVKVYDRLVAVAAFWACKKSCL